MIPPIFASAGARKRVLGLTLISVALSAVYAFTAPKWYRSVLTVVPAAAQKSSMSSVLGSLGGLAAGLESSIGAAADSARIAAVLQSTSVTDAVVKKFGLQSRYHASYLEAAREELWRHCDVRTLPKPNLVQLSCEDRDPWFAQQLLAYFAEYGNQVFRRVSVNSASEEVRFLEKRVGELQQQADDVANRMRTFQETYGIVDLDTQAKAVVSALAALNSQRLNKQLQLGYARTFSSQDEAGLRQLQSQLSVMEEQLRDLQEPSATTSEPPARSGAKRRGADVFPAALAVPKLRAQFEKLYRDRKVSEATLIFALERLEGAKANEARDVSTFLVLDPPTLPTRKSRPQRLYIILTVALLAFSAASGLEWWRSARSAGGGNNPVAAAITSTTGIREGASHTR